MTMTYCTQADIENIFGAVNVATWSQLDNDTEDADTARIAKAIEWATSWLDEWAWGDNDADPNGKADKFLELAGGEIITS